MMKHENPSKPIPFGNNHNNGVLPVASPNSGKRSIWRSRSSSEAPASAPKSPITKAFDFLPWSRSRKSAAEKAAIANSVNIVGNKDANTVESRDTSEEYKKDCINYHRNIFRNGGGIIRDILGDKLNKERSQVLPSDAVGNSNLPNTHSLKGNQRRPKQVVARNKSLDINELIDCVDNELAVDKKNFARSRFIDDTFIENIIRAKNEYHRNSRLQGDHQIEDDYVYSNSYYGDELVNNADSGEKRKENTNLGCSTPSKHILFNDENIVYLIKKELPVKREMSKTKSAIEHNSRAHQQKTTNSDKERKHERSTSVLRARLKFKKVASPESTPLTEQRSQLWNNQQKHPQPQQSGSERSNYLQSKSVIDNCAIIGMASAGLSLMNPAGGSFKQNSSGLQRQNTLPAAPPSHQRSVNDSSELHHGRQHQRSEQHSQRRKSLTDTCFENNLCFDNSSSSSMGSGGGGGVGGGIINDRSKTEKPRKKLSFREPVVSEKGRSRRISTPLHKSPGSPVGGINSVVATESSSNACVSQTTMKANCDNSNQLLDQRFARNGTESAVADQTAAADTESQAMRIVRTVGQAFEVCHKFNLHKNSLDNNDERSDVSSDLLDVDHISEHQLSDDDVAKKDQNAVTPDLNPPQRPNHLELVPQTNLNIRKSPCVLTDDEKSPTTPSSPNREIHKLKDQLEQQALQTRQALAQLMLVREQLISETNARIEAQARTQQLLQQNRELLEHLASLGAYTEQQAPGLTTANIAMAPQSQLQMLLQATSNNNNLATINQQINNLGSINQQLTSLSHQLSGLNQQSQNLQNLQNINANMQQHQHQQQQQQHLQQQSLTPPTPSTSRNPSQLHLNVSAANVTSSTGTLSTSPFPSMNQLQSISAQLQNMSAQSSQQQQDALSKDLFQVNQELLNRLQVLNLGAGHSASTNATLTLNGSPLPITQQTPSPNSSFFFVNPMSCSPSNNNNSASNFNFLSSPSGLSAGNLTPSPMGTLNRNSYSNSPINDELGLSIDKNLNSLDEHGLMKPLGQLSTAASNGNIASGSTATTRDNSRSSSTVESPSSPNIRNGNEARFNTVMLKVTDEAGNVTNQRKLSATPSFITRSTSEKVPNRSQMMSQVQRTAWARHTTK